jgi:hypothetical protein
MAGNRKYIPLGDGIKVNEQNGDYTLVKGDAGAIISKLSGGAGETFTIPANSAVPFPVGTLIGFTNDAGGAVTIAITTDTLEDTDGNTGSRSLADNHSATIEKISPAKWRYSSTEATTGSGANQLSELSDVADSTATNRFALMADGTDFHARALVSADLPNKNIGVFSDSSSQALTTTEATLVFDTEDEDVDTNYVLASGEITVTDAGWYFVSVNILVENDSIDNDTRTRLDVWLQQDASTSTWTDVNTVRAATEIREAASFPGGGVNPAGIVQLVANEVIRVRVDQSHTTDNSTTAGECTLNIFRISE